MTRKSLYSRMRRGATETTEDIAPRKLRIESDLDTLFANSEQTFLESPDLRALGLIVFALMADWQAWIARRVETVTFLDADTVRRQVSVDFTVPKLPTVIELDGQPLHFLPLTLLRKRRLTHFDLCDETGRALPLVTRRANGPLAASALAEAAMAFQPDPQLRSIPRGNLSAELWRMATLPAGDARKTWRDLAQTRSGENPAERDLRDALTKSWHFLSLANDLTRNFLVVTPLFAQSGDRRIIKFAYTEQVRFPSVTLARRRRRHTTRGLEGPRHTLTVKATAEDGKGDLPMADLAFSLRKDDRSWEAAERTWTNGEWTRQVDEGSYALEIVTPTGLMLTGEVDQSVLKIAQDVTVNLRFRRVPATPSHPVERPASQRGWRRGRDSRSTGHTDTAIARQTARKASGVVGGRPAERLAVWRKFLRLFGWSPKTVYIVVPAAGESRSYHFEYVVSAGMKATCSILGALPTTRWPAEDPPAKDAPVEDPPTDSPPEHSLSPPPPDWHVPTEHRVHLYRTNVPQDYAGIAEIKLRPCTSTIVRGASMVSLLSLLMVAVLRWRWQTLGTQNIGTEVALLLAVPGGLSAYVARSQRDNFTSIVLMGLRGLALSSVLWCLAAATLIATSRAVDIKEGKTQVGNPMSWTNCGLDFVLLLNAASLLLLTAAWYRSARPPEALAIEESDDN
jgi:hypothetical protein